MLLMRLLRVLPLDRTVMIAVAVFMAHLGQQMLAGWWKPFTSLLRFLYVGMCVGIPVEIARPV